LSFPSNFLLNFNFQLGRYDKATWERTFEEQEQEQVRDWSLIIIVLLRKGSGHKMNGPVLQEQCFNSVLKSDL